MGNMKEFLSNQKVWVVMGITLGVTWGVDWLFGLLAARAGGWETLVALLTGLVFFLVLFQ